MTEGLKVRQGIRREVREDEKMGNIPLQKE